MPSARRPAVPTEAVAPVRLTERLLVNGLTIKDDLQKAFENWELNFRDPVKAALLAMPPNADGEVSQVTMGGVRLILAKTFPKSSWDTMRMQVALSRAISSSAIQLADLHTLLDAGAITIAKPDQVAQLLATRAHVNASSFAVVPAHPDVPSRVDLKWGAVPGGQPLVGPLQDLPDRVAVAAAAALNGDATVRRPEGAIQRAAEIDRANAQLLSERGPAEARPAGTVAVRRDPPRATAAELAEVTPREDLGPITQPPAARPPRRRRTR